MKTSEIFTTGNDPFQSIGGYAEYLDRNNCKISKVVKNTNSIDITLKRELDGAEGYSHIRVKEELKNIENQLFEYLSKNLNIIGITLNELDNLNVGSEIEQLVKKYSIK